LNRVETLAKQVKPKIIFCGGTAYPRTWDYAGFATIAASIGAVLVADIAHIAGLIVAGAHPHPYPHATIVTTTTHKTLRGPRGGMVLCRAEHAKTVDAAVFPGLQGGPHMNTIAGVAVTLEKALQEDFKTHCRDVLANAKALAQGLLDRGAELVTGGTDNHMMVLDTVKSFGIDGRAAERALDRVAITVNKQIIPDDPNPPLRPSGIRLGTPAATTRGMGPDHMRQLAGWIDRALRNHEDREVLGEIRSEVEELCLSLPVPGLG
jgi:glycine hydroxymethyltransferase